MPTKAKTKVSTEVLEVSGAEVVPAQQEVVETPPLPVASDSSPIALIERAVANNVSVETIEKLMDLRDRWKREQSKEAFDRAMADFQSECPIIEKVKPGGETRNGTVAYKYAPLEVIVAQVKDLLRKHGFSYSFNTLTDDQAGTVTAICTAKHSDGHSEESSMQVPLGTKTQIMSSTQQTAAAITYAKRYAFCNAFGILTGDEDNDGQVVSAQPTPTTPQSAPQSAPTQPQAPAQPAVANTNAAAQSEPVERQPLNVTLAIKVINGVTDIGMLQAKLAELDSPESVATITQKKLLRATIENRIRILSEDGVDRPVTIEEVQQSLGGGGE